MWETQYCISALKDVLALLKDRSVAAVLTLSGCVLTRSTAQVMMMYRVRGAIVIGILVVSNISWPHPTSVTFFPYMEIGDADFDFPRKVVSFRVSRNHWTITTVRKGQDLAIR